MAYDDVLTTIHRAVVSVQNPQIHCFGQTWPVRGHADPMLRADSAALRLIVFESDIGGRPHCSGSSRVGSVEIPQ